MKVKSFIFGVLFSSFIFMFSNLSYAGTLEQQMAQLAAHISALNASNAEIIRQINEMNQRITALQQNQQNLQNNLNTLKQDLDNTKKAWQTANEKMIEQISKEMADLARKSATTAQQSSGRTAGQSGPRGQGEFYVHRVEPGSTLNAIARAYGVTTEEIRNANGMTNDLIRVGQILYIPKKQ